MSTSTIKENNPTKNKNDDSCDQKETKADLNNETQRSKRIRTNQQGGQRGQGGKQLDKDQNKNQGKGERKGKGQQNQADPGQGRNKGRGKGKGRRGNNNNNHDRKLSKALSWVLRHGAPDLNLTMSTDGYVPLSALLACQARSLNTYTQDDIQRVVQSNDKQRFRIDMKRVAWITNKKNANKKNNNKNKDRITYAFIDNSLLSSSPSPSSEQHEDGESTTATTTASTASTATTIEQDVLCIRANQGHSITGISSHKLLTTIPLDQLKGLTIIHGTYRQAWINHIRHDGLNRMKRNHIHFASGLPTDTDTDGGGVISGMRRSCQIYIYIDGGACARDDITFYKSDNGVILTAGVEEGKDQTDTETKTETGTCREGDVSSGILPCRYFASVIDADSKKELLGVVDD